MSEKPFVGNVEPEEYIDPEERCELCGGPLGEWGFCEICDEEDHDIDEDDEETFDDEELKELDFGDEDDD
jgi:hypothetical protein